VERWGRIEANFSSDDSERETFRIPQHHETARGGVEGLGLWIYIGLLHNYSRLTLTNYDADTSLQIALNSAFTELGMSQHAKGSLLWSSAETHRVVSMMSLLQQRNQQSDKSDLIGELKYWRYECSDLWTSSLIKHISECCEPHDGGQWPPMASIHKVLRTNLFVSRHRQGKCRLPAGNYGI
jgi:hypothetical protein